MSIPLSFLRTTSSPLSGTSLGDLIGDQLSQSHRIHSLLDCLCATSNAAIYSQESSHPLTHRDLRSFISNFALPRSSHIRSRKPLGKNSRIALILPSGPENAVALLAITAYHTCAPLNASCTAAELKEDVVRLGVKAIVTKKEYSENLALASLAAELNLVVVYVQSRSSGPVGLFDMISMDGSRPISTLPSPLQGLDDQSLILHTSGTSGKKKVVPYTLRSLIVGTWAVVQSWDLQPSDVNLNMMPLFHVGGIVRNLLAPVMSGGSTVVCPGFDAISFWHVAHSLRATWYYGAPTIHHAILASQPRNIIPSRDLHIRMICNAAGGLLPSLAAELRDRFTGAIILPSYGMTECMPIASPPTSYQLDRPGCSGIACGPHLSIRNPQDLEKALSPGKTGAICVRGLPMFQGYEVSPDLSVPLDTSSFTSEGWFDTGDMGYMDSDGYLYITGRSKEIINKGGEVISPFEVEEAVVLAGNGYVKATLAFSIEHDVLQETIGVVVVPDESRPRIGLSQLHDLLRGHLHPSKWPFAIVYMNDLPKNSAGKPLRIKLSDRLGLECMTDTRPSLRRHFEAQAPPPGAALSDPIRCAQISIDYAQVCRVLMQIAGTRDATVRAHQDGTIEAFVSVHPGARTDMSIYKSHLWASLPGYSIPELHILDTSLDEANLDAYKNGKTMDRKMSVEEALVRDVVAEVLGIPPEKIGPSSDFFLLGGTSLLLGKLAHQLRKQTGASVAVTGIYTQSTIAGIASFVSKHRAAQENKFRELSPSPSPWRDSPTPTKFSIPSSPTISMENLNPFLSKPPMVHEKENRWSSVTLMADTHSGVFSPLGSTEDLVSTRGPSTPPSPQMNHPTSYLSNNGMFRDSKESKRRSQYHPLVLIVQVMPFVFFYPLKAALTWTMLIYLLSYLAPYVDGNFFERMGALIAAILGARLTTRTIAPCTAILFKWLVIWKYKPGTYPMWSNYYLRYWIVNQSLTIAGKGIFLTHPAMTQLYYRLLGAKIGSDVKIDPSAHLGEYDLLTIGDGCRIDNALLRGFCVERDGCFRLDRIVVGRSSVINTYTQISPGAVLPERSLYGPHSSSLEEQSPPECEIANKQSLLGPHWALLVFVAFPVITLTTLIAYTPWFGILYLMFDQTFVLNNGTNVLVSVIFWFASPRRIAFHLIARVVRDSITPVLKIFLGIAVKRALGLNREYSSAKGVPQLVLLRRYINSSLLSPGKLKDAFNILGTHYESVSIAYRLMGAKIGKRIYWPGSGIRCDDPELLEIGDDVVFGSRSELRTTDLLGSRKIVIGNGAMIADRVVLMPGTKVGSRAVMGSGALGSRNATYSDGSTWIGSERGEAICLNRGSTSTEKKDTITPFGRAFYQREAPYFVFPYALVVLVNFISSAFTALYWAAGAVFAAQALEALYIYSDVNWFGQQWYEFALLYIIIAATYLCVLNVQSILALLWVLVSKWIIIGRRHAGRYDWNSSSYCQRWQLHLTLSNVIYRCLGPGGLLTPLTGTPFIAWFYRAQGAKIGKNCTLYPGGKAGLMTEPDLVELGDNVSLDDCSVVAHINSRGNFSLNALKIGDGCAMRSGSRLLSGASMEEYSMLCEHTLLTSGEVAETKGVYIGWPASRHL